MTTEARSTLASTRRRCRRRRHRHQWFWGREEARGSVGGRARARRSSTLEPAMRRRTQGAAPCPLASPAYWRARARVDWRRFTVLLGFLSRYAENKAKGGPGTSLSHSTVRVEQSCRLLCVVRKVDRNTRNRLNRSMVRYFTHCAIKKRGKHSPVATTCKFDCLDSGRSERGFKGILYFTDFN